MDATTAVKGVASFSSGNFSVTSGAVSIKSQGVSAANLNVGTGAGQIYAATIPCDTTNFTGNLSAADTDVQKALDTIDNRAAVGTYYVTGLLSYNVLSTESYQVILVNTHASGTDIALATVASYGNGRRIFVKRLDAGAGVLRIVANAAGGETIDGAATYTVTNQYDCVELVGYGTNWNIVSNKN